MRSEGYCSRPVCVCVCVCFQGLHLRLVQLSDKLGILVISVSCSLVFKFGVFRIIAFLAKLEFSCYSLRYKSAILYTSRVRLYSAHARSRGAHVNWAWWISLEPYSGILSMRLKKVCPQCDATLHHVS